jgi:tetratricopeptide (TPR) repeat protein
MKKILSISFVLILAIGLTACGETKEEKIADNIIDMAEKTGEKMNDQTKEIFKDAIENSPEFQKEIADEMAQLPKVMKVAKSYRSCLADADDKDDAIECYEEADEYADKLGIIEEDEEDLNPEEEFGEWTAEDKAKLLAEMDEGLKFFEQMNK